MIDRENTDVWTAVAIGAVVGIGAALIMRARQDDDTHALIRSLRPVQKRASKAVKTARREVGRRTSQAGKAGGNLMEAGSDILDDLRQGASEIVQDTRDELRRAARDSVREARKAARRVTR
jgi:gas vesicle protein